MTLNPWPPSLRRPYARGHQNMRSLTYNGTAKVPAWVWAPRDRPRVCLTLGTVLPWLSAAGRAEAVLPLLRAVAELGVELVVAMDDRVAASWPALPDAVRHAGRLPLSQVLPTCDVAIHHGGQGTSLTALETGRPQLVLPQFDDQFDNAEAVARAGAGTVLLPEQNAPRAVAEHCAELLDDPTYGLAAARTAGEISAQPAPLDLVTLLEATATRANPAAAA
jgi:UDP:flavonoid glycosyltransferase YjiC (YdhE family)